MNRYKTNTNGELTHTAPLFASSWLALYYVLRENYGERRAPAKRPESTTQSKEK